MIVDLGPGAGDGRALTAAVVDAGAPVVQVRVKGVDDRTRYELTAPLVELCAQRGVTCIVNDRADVAVAVGAQGVHLGAEDLPVAAARAVVPPRMLVGGTVRTPAAGRDLQAQGASYLGVGPVYSTVSKQGLPRPIGLAGLGAVAAAVHVPVIAIAGMTAARVPEVLAAGAHGVAVIGAIARAGDPASATRAFLRELERA